MEEGKMYDNFISLGWNCLVASSMSKHGLRSASGPFDWCKSSFKGVIELLDNDFEEFLDYKNLEVNENKHVVDIKYNIEYVHDFAQSIDEQYEEVKCKYFRRIYRFREMIQQKTCFIRTIWSVEDLCFLEREEERIKAVIRGNDLIVVVPRFIYEKNPVRSSFKIFIVDAQLSGFVLGREEARSFFDTSQELLSFLYENYDIDKRKDNSIIDLNSELKYAREHSGDKILLDRIEKLKGTVIELRRQNMRVESRLNLWMRVLNTDYSTIICREKIIIYGCGAIGRILYKYMKEYFSIIGFIDRKPRQDLYDEIPVYSLDDTNIPSLSDVLVIVVPTYDIEKIKEDLKKCIGYCENAIGLEEFLARGEILDMNF